MRPSQNSHHASLIVAIGVFLFAMGCSHQRTNTYQGYVEGKYVYVASAQSGRLTSLSVARGQTIEAGSPVFQLESEPEAAAESRAEYLLRASEARLADLQTGKRPPEVNETREQLLQAQAESRKTTQILKSDEAQYRAGGIPQTDLIDAQAAADADAAVVRQLENELTVASLPAREQQIKAQMAEVRADRAALRQATWNLQQKAVSSPRDGLVFDTLYRVGEWVPAGTPVVQLLPPGTVEVRFFVPEPVLGSLRVGQPITVSCDGCSSNIAASITFISPEAEYTPPIIYSNERRSKLVFLVIAKSSPRQAMQLHPGEPVEVTLP
jgi:HlyD family secretion protein